MRRQTLSPHTRRARYRGPDVATFDIRVHVTGDQPGQTMKAFDEAIRRVADEHADIEIRWNTRRDRPGH